MKQTLIPILLFILCSVNLTAQDTIVLDGKKIPKKELDFFNGVGYEVDLSKPEYASYLKNVSVEKDKRITSQHIFVSKGFKSYVQTTVYEDADSALYYLPSSDLKFFDEKGKVKWEKKLDGEKTRYCYLSSDGKYSIFDLKNCRTSDEGDLKNSLSIFDEKGDTFCEYTNPVEFEVSRSRDLVCYQEDVSSTLNFESKKTFYCVDLKTAKHWSKTFEKEVEPYQICNSGNYIIVWSKADSIYTLYNREGKEIFKKQLKEFGGGITEISYDGKYALVIKSSIKDTSFFYIIDINSMKLFRTKYLDLGNATYKIFNGGCFVENSKYIVALTSIIAPYTAMIILHNLQGEYIGHKVYYNIQSSFYTPTITLLNDGSFEVYVDGYYLENLTLPGVNTKQYLSKTTE
jgi:hypothetical protein